MINGISFTGRETMLTKPVEKVVSKAHEYVSSSKIFSSAEDIFNATAKSNAEKRIDRLHEYTPTSKIYSQAERENIEVPADLDKTSLLNYSNQAAASYALSHGTPKEVLPEVVAKSIDVKNNN